MGSMDYYPFLDPNYTTQTCPLQPPASLLTEPDFFDFLVSLVSLLIYVIYLNGSLDLNPKEFSIGRMLRLLTEHFRFVMLVYIGNGRELNDGLQLLFGIIFPVYGVSVTLYQYTVFPVAKWLALDYVLCEGCLEVVSFNLLLLLTAIGLMFSTKDTNISFGRLSYFNIMALPDVQLVISRYFAGLSFAANFWLGTFYFAVSVQWVLFSILLPLIMLVDLKDKFPLGGKLYSTDFRFGLRHWRFMVKFQQVLFIYHSHISAVLLPTLPGLSMLLGVVMVLVFRQFQVTYWPYSFRVMNCICDDTYMSLLLLLIWTKFEVTWLLVIAFFLPARQFWRLWNVS